MNIIHLLAQAAKSVGQSHNDGPSMPRSRAAVRHLAQSDGRSRGKPSQVENGILDAFLVREIASLLRRQEKSPVSKPQSLVIDHRLVQNDVQVHDGGPYG